MFGRRGSNIPDRDLQHILPQLAGVGTEVDHGAGAALLLRDMVQHGEGPGGGGRLRCVGLDLHGIEHAVLLDDQVDLVLCLRDPSVRSGVEPVLPAVAYCPTKHKTIQDIDMQT